jgi:DTW domain-containing protein YfiP
MFRKCSALHSLPRLSLLNTRTSSYVLRGDFGWREKFGGGGGGGGGGRHSSSAARAGGNNEDEAELLCTAEVGGELLRRAGHLEGSAQVVRVLQEFQMRYAESHPHIALRLRGREGSKQG